MPFKPNKQRLRNRSDYGVRVARPGYDAMNCAQNQLLFNSGWPILQIVDVIDMTWEGDYEYKLTINVTRINNVTGDVNRNTTDSIVSEPPAGYTSSYETDATIDTFREVSVNTKNIRKTENMPITMYIYNTDVRTEGDYTIITDQRCSKVAVVKKSHNLGYTPFFMMSEDISEVSGYIVLFSVDITTDVDYPYTEKPLQILGSSSDYGIKSSSIFGSKVPGLCSNMFSKLVQAIKTQDTSRGSDDAGQGLDTMRVIWSPVNDPNEATDGMLLPYEFYAFTNSDGYGTFADGGPYYHREYPAYLPPTNSSEDYNKDAWAVSADSFQAPVDFKNTLVVLRSPMVSPEYEERII